MIHTFDFLRVLRRDENERNIVLAMIDAGQNAEYDIGSCHMQLDQERNVVTVTDNGRDKFLSVKIIPAEIPLSSLKHLIVCDEDSLFNADLGIRFP